VIEITMKRMFIETNEFRSRWVELGMTEEALCELQNYLLEYPEAGPVVPGTGGIRKVRWNREGRGKSGGIRVIYIDSCNRETTWLITVFGKNEKSNLSPREKSTIKAFVKSLWGEENDG